jgi:hypothetical protein
MQNKKLIFILGLILVASAAFVGGRLLNGQALLAGGLNLFPGNGGRQEVRINSDDIQPAKELPATRPEVRGLFDHRQDNSIFVGTGKVTIGVQTDDAGEAETAADYDGPIVEVVVTSQTTVYEDVTMRQFNEGPPEGEKIQQIVKTGSLDSLSQFSTIAVWGKKTGDRIIAEVLVYQPLTLAEK